MTLRLSAEIVADASGFQPGAAAARAEIADVGTAAQTAGQRTRVLTDALTGAAASERRLGEEIDRRLGIMQRDDPARRAADIAAYGAELDAVRAKFNPLFAAEQRHLQLLGEIDTAHRTGAISTSEMRSAVERATVAYDAQARAIETAQAAVRAYAAELARVPAGPSSAVAIDARLGIGQGGDQAARAADIAAYGASLDDLRAKFNPLFAAEQRHLQLLGDIDTAHRTGAISTTEMRAAVERATVAYDAETRAIETAQAAIRSYAAELARVPASPRSAGAIDARLGIGQTGDRAARAADIAAYGASLDDLRAKYSPLYDAQRRYRAELAEIRGAERAGALSTREAAAAVDRSKAAFAGQVTAIRAARGELVGLAGWQRTNLMAQGFDTFTSLAGGMNPLLVAAQQGPQIIQVYGGVRQTLAAATAVLTPLRLGLGGTTAALLLGATAWQGYLSSVKDVEAAATGMGRGLGANADMLEAIAGRGAAAAGISVASARGIEAQLLRTGTIGVASFEGLISISRDFATTIGASREEANAELARIFADPARGAETLYRQYNLLDGATARYVQRLVAQGREEEARGVLLAALPARLADAERATTALGRAWDLLGRSASNAMDAIGSTIDRLLSAPSLSDRIADIASEMDAIRRSQSNPELRDAELAALQEQQDRLSGILKLEQERARIQSDELAARRRFGEALSVADRSPATADWRRRETLIDERELLGRNRFGGSAEEEARIAAAIDAKTQALATWISEADRARQLAEIDIQLMGETNPLRRAELVAMREGITLRGLEVTADAAAARVEAARRRALAEELAQYQSRHTAMAEEAQARAVVNDLVARGTIGLAEADRMLRAEVELRPLIAAAALAEGAAREALLGKITALREAYAGLAAEEARSAALQDIAGRRDRIADLELELRLVGQSEQARARALALAEAERDIRDRGLGTATAEAAQIRALAVAEADREIALDRTRAAWDRLRDTASGTIDSLVEGLRTGDLETAFESIVEDWSKTLAELTLANPLKNLLLGENLPTAADAGGLLGRLLGGVSDGALTPTTSAVGTMTVTAGSVVITGALGGGLGGAASALVGGGTTATAAASRLAGPEAAAQLARYLGAGRGPEAVASLDQGFAASLAKMLADAPPAIREAVSINSGWRSPERQQQLWDQALAKYGSPEAARKWVAPPGRSQHNFGNAADLGFRSPEARQWFHRNAEGYGLNFPMSHEPWHIEGRRGGAAEGELPAVLDSASGRLKELGDASAAANDNLLGFGTSAADVGRSLSESAAGVAAGGKQLQATTAGLGEQSAGLFETLFGSLGKVADGFVSGLGGILEQILSGLGGSGGGGGLLSSLLSAIGGLLGFESGGYTGIGGRQEPAGIVHRGEYVMDADTTRLIGIGTLDKLRTAARRGYAAGGLAGTPGMVPVLGGWTPGGSVAAQGAGVQVRFETKIINNVAGVEVREEEEDDGRGGRQTRYVIDEAVSGATRRPKTRNALNANFGVRERLVNR